MCTWLSKTVLISIFLFLTHRFLVSCACFAKPVDLFIKVVCVFSVFLFLFRFHQITSSSRDHFAQGQKRSQSKKWVGYQMSPRVKESILFQRSNVVFIQQILYIMQFLYFKNRLVWKEMFYVCCTCLMYYSICAHIVYIVIHLQWATVFLF